MRLKAQRRGVPHYCQHDSRKLAHYYYLLLSKTRINSFIMMLLYVWAYNIYFVRSSSRDLSRQTLVPQRKKVGLGIGNITASSGVMTVTAEEELALTKRSETKHY